MLRLTTTGISLVDLRTALTGRKLIVPSDMDIHVCAQYHPIWNLDFDRVITLNIDENNLNGGINAIENDFNLDRTEFNATSEFDELRHQHYALETEYQSDVPVEEFQFTSELTKSFPKKALEKSCFLNEMARELHAVDYPHVGSGDTEGKITFAAKSKKG